MIKRGNPGLIQLIPLGSEAQWAKAFGHFIQEVCIFISVVKQLLKVWMVSNAYMPFRFRDVNIVQDSGCLSSLHISSSLPRRVCTHWVSDSTIMHSRNLLKDISLCGNSLNYIMQTAFVIEVSDGSRGHRCSGLEFWSKGGSPCTCRKRYSDVDTDKK